MACPDCTCHDDPLSRLICRVEAAVKTVKGLYARAKVFVGKLQLLKF